MGHERIGLITTGLGDGDPVEQLERIAFNPRPASTTDARGAGYLAALRAANLPVDADLIVNAPYCREGALRAVAGLLGGNARPTALFTVDNVMTLRPTKRSSGADSVFPGTSPCWGSTTWSGRPSCARLSA